MSLRTTPGWKSVVRAGWICAALAAGSLAAWSTGGNEPVVATATPPAPQPAIAELPHGGYEVMTAPPPQVALAEARGLAGAGSARVLRLAVALVTFEDAPAEPFSAAQVDTTLFGAAGSVAELYAEQSFGLLQLTGDVFGWLSVPRGELPCDFTAWAESAAAEIGDETLSSYTNLLVVLPPTSACTWSGLAYVGGTTAWVNGEPSARSAGHELGHNLGLGHASSLRCAGPGGRVPLSADCKKADEYGDPFSLMGSGGTLHVNGIHKSQLGWLPPENVIDVTSTGTYALGPLGARSSLPQVLRIGRGDSTLVVEYRQPVGGFERFGGPLEPRGGITARLATGAGISQQSLLIDAVASTVSYADAALAPGHDLVDAATGVRVSVRVATGDQAIVHVFVPGTVATGGLGPRPAAPTTLAAVVTPGPKRARVDLSWLPSDAPVQVRRYLLLRNGRVVASTRTPAVTRFEEHGRNVYRIVAVGEGGVRSPRSRRLVVSTARARSADAQRSPIRGVAVSPTPNGRLALTLRGRSRESVTVRSQRLSARLPAGGALVLHASAGRTRFLLRPITRPGARPTQVIAVRKPPLAG